ncbi:aminopeptidase P family protein [Pseudooctadecabacter jejudonensis]|uniref:Putative peptidase n=1 Tax=Pseudooctadecabacter jejudonensis TaxID=1391910 RepID=A0A1Y5RPZ1_9RHOB|nr:aminopeptidase P family protein [Pseudooctadecabacter jejudonensis]SLN19729.1 putative peptidase [Pseudooctadecabacter jejudonensis]
MFQTFDVTSSADAGPARLDALRSVMAERGVDGFVVPREDRFQGEYVAPADERLSWLTGFTGSAGFAVVAQDKAGVFVDGRYRVQVKQQVADVFEPVHWPETTLSDWVKSIGGLDVLAFDPWLHTVAQIEGFEAAFVGTQVSLTPTENLVDLCWADRPLPPLAPMMMYPDDLAGETSSSKRARLAEDLRGAGHRAAFIALPDSIAWLLNVRGSDIARNPVPHAMALLKDDGTVILFCDPRQIGDIELEGVTVSSPDTILDALAATEGPIRLDRARTPYAVAQALTENAIAWGQDPCVLPKARKTDAEIAGAREAHLRDGAAMVRFLAWLDREAPKGALTEIDVVTALEGFRRDTNVLRDISFETICGAGPNGAIVHYRVSEDSNRRVTPGELLLVDSGGQYLDGTTDITRTIAIGPAGDTERTCYTRVLQGMIAISRVRFPKGVRGSDLDALARYPLWLAGQDYDHGTGHGVGAYLCVHEGPQGLSRRATTALEPGMILSNEPGYYREGAFGIRIENLIVVQDAPAVPGGDARAMLDFETLTYVPFDRHLIDVTLLSGDERAWIDQYHSDTLQKIGLRVDGDALDWLKSACAPLSS